MIRSKTHLHSLAWNSLVRCRGMSRMSLPCSPRQGLSGHVCPRSIALGRLSARRLRVSYATRRLRVDNEFYAFYTFLALRTHLHSNGLSYSHHSAHSRGPVAWRCVAGSDD